jgi:hypothetical protein
MRKLTNLDYQDPEYWEQEEPVASQPQTKRGELVRPLPQQTVTARRYQPVNVSMNIPQQSVMTVDMRTSAVDRAQGFTIETHQLSVVTGLLAVLIAVVGFGHPFLALGTLWTFGVWYTLIWFMAWLFHRIISPEGLAWYNAVMAWRYLDKYRG